MSNKLNLHPADQALAEFKKLGFSEGKCSKQCHRLCMYFHFYGKTSFKMPMANGNSLVCYFTEREMPFIVKNIDKFEYLINSWSQEGFYRIETSDLLEILVDGDL